MALHSTKALYLLFKRLYKHNNEWNIEEIYERFPIGLISQKNHRKRPLFAL